MPKQTKKKPAAPRPAETFEARNARIAASLSLVNLGDHERAFLATCQRIHRRETGCNSPFEEFFNSLVIAVELEDWPTPDDVADHLEEFRLNWNDMKRDAKLFLETYPEKENAQPEGIPRPRKSRHKAA